MSQPIASAATFPYNLRSQKRKMQVVDQDQNQVAAVGAVAPNAIAQPSVFKLDADCWDEVFDCLSIEDVHSFGQTCKAFQRIAGEYFKWKYVNVTADLKEDGIYIDGKRMNGFSAFVQNLRLYESATIPKSITHSKLRYVELNCKAVKHMQFHHVNFHWLNFKLIKNLLMKIEVLDLHTCHFNANKFGALIESCVTLKRLKFTGDNDFPVCKHSTLEYLELYQYDDTVRRNGALNILLEQSPNLQCLEIFAYHLYRYRDSILKANVELNDLTIFLGENAKDVAAGLVVLLNELHQRGFYKRLHVDSCARLSPDQLLALPGLVTLYHRDRIADYPLLVSIKELVIRSGPIINPTKMTNSFINVEYISSDETYLEDIRPFVRHSAKLKVIYIRQFKEDVLDIRTLNKERKKLLGSPKVTIYVDEKTYLATKWASKGTTFDLIEIRRKSSHNIIRPYSVPWANYII